LLEAYLGRRMKRGKEDLVRFQERRGRPTRTRENKPLVWFHAASVGESQSLLVLIQCLLANDPSIQVMVTTGTVTSAKLMAERLPPRAFHQYMPVDHPDWTENFLEYWRPELIIWAESEFWPSILMGIQKRHIPAILLNARMSEASFRRWHLAKGAIRAMLKTFQLCLGQNQAEVDRLLRLGAVVAKVSGNLKYAAAPLPYDQDKFILLQKAIGVRPHLLWAATHPGEEEIACRIHQQLRGLFPALLTMIVPRHPQRGAEVAALAAKAGLKAALRSRGRLPQAGDDLYIADTLGEMGLFYRLAQLCIMGGSFVPTGGHNIIEPAQLGCQIFYGPYMFNFISICDDFESRGAALRVVDEKQLADTLLLALQDPQHFSAMADAARHWTERQSHIVDEISADIAPFMSQIKARAA
ncbi:MAG: 3-deoxy-D-manno-octulosonic acid transferase, partial [Proteobacteria bacterium]|nr:3-deoxy-D-manno-octulosonic acid transferase [Pseudomonadota bacterium]